MKRLPMIALTIPFLLMLAVSSQASAPSGHNLVLAVVDGQPVTAEDMISTFSSRHSGHSKFLGGESEARRFLNILIEDRLLINEAYALGLDEEPEAARMIEEYGLRIAANYLVKQELVEASKPTPAEVRRVWEEELDTVLQARQIRVETREEAEQIRAALVAGADAESIARECSLADSSRRGGVMVASWGQLPLAVEQMIFELLPGEISPVIESDEGFEVYVIENRVVPSRPDLDKVSEEIEAKLSARKLEANKAALSKRLFDKYHVVLEAIDFNAVPVNQMLATAPDTIVARWDGGGQLKLRDAVDEKMLTQLEGTSTVSARKKIVEQVHATIHSPLLMIEAKERNIRDVPEVATAIESYTDYLVESFLFRDHIFRNLNVAEDELRTYYDQHLAEFDASEERKIAQVLVGSEADANEALKEIATGTAFDEVAKKRSRDFQTAMTGGDLGWVRSDNVPAPFKTVLDLKAGEVTKPVKGDRGWHVFKVVEIRPKRVQPFEEVKEAVKAKALDAKKRAARSQWVEKLRAAAKVTIDDKAIAKFVKQNEFDANAPAPQHAMPAGALPEGAMPGTQPHGGPH
jgi:parvulin-like peptidyl-prolyl isomerase